MAVSTLLTITGVCKHLVDVKQKCLTGKKRVDYNEDEDFVHLFLN